MYRYTYFDNYEIVSTESDSDNDFVTTILGAGVLGAMAIGGKIADSIANASIESAKRETAKLEYELKRKEEKRQWFHKHRYIFYALFTICVCSILSSFIYYEYNKLAPISYSSESLVGLEYNEVVQKLEEVGFSCIITRKDASLDAYELDKENSVSYIQIGFKDKLKSNNKYPSNLPIFVTYYTAKTISLDLSSEDLKELYYKDVVSKFTNLGFYNIEVKPKYDIVAGWINEVGTLTL